MVKKAFKPKSFEERKKEINELTDSLHERVNSYFNTPEQMKEYLGFKARFYQYSNRNTALIQSQFQGAEAVGNFGFWKKHGFSVNKGEKGIKILKPSPFEYFRRGDGQEKIPVNKATAQEKQMIQDKKLKVYTDQYFTITHVFDISQTNATANDLPKIFPNRWLEGEVENYDLVYKSLEKVAEVNGIKIVEPYEELGVAKGVSYPELKEVALNPRNSELQNVKTLIHELAHATLHTAEKRDQYNHNEREFQAELTAFTVASYLGLDTSEYSLNYISAYSKDETKFDDKIRLLDEVKTTSQSFIEVIEKEIVQDRNLEKEEMEQEHSNEPKVTIEWSEVEGLKSNTTMSFKEMNDFLLNANKELQTSFHEDGTPVINSNKNLFEVDTKYKVIDTEGNIFSPSKFTMSKMESNQIFSSISQQIYIQESELYKKLSESYEFTSKELGITDEKINENLETSNDPIKTLEAKFTEYQRLLQAESLGTFNEETIVERLNIENDYFDNKSELIKTGVVTDKNVKDLEGKVVAALQKNQQDKQVVHNRSVIEELER